MNSKAFLRKSAYAKSRKEVKEPGMKQYCHRCAGAFSMFHFLRRKHLHMKTPGEEISKVHWDWTSVGHRMKYVNWI